MESIVDSQHLENKGVDKEQAEHISVDLLPVPPRRSLPHRLPLTCSMLLNY